MDLSFYFLVVCVYDPFDSFWLDFMWVFVVFVYIYVACMSHLVLFLIELYVGVPALT